MREYLCFLVVFSRLISLSVAKALDLGLLHIQQATTLPSSALLECTPSNCTQHSECNWKYCPITGHVPKCVKGNYTTTCCECIDELPNIISLMMSTTCSKLQPLRFMKGYYDNGGGPPTKICHKMFRNDIRRKGSKLKQLYGKISSDRLKSMQAKKMKNYLEFEINRLHQKKLLLYQVRKIYETLYITKNYEGDATEDGGNNYYSSTNQNNILTSTVGTDTSESNNENIFTDNSTTKMYDTLYLTKSYEGDAAEDGGNNYYLSTNQNNILRSTVDTNILDSNNKINLTDNFNMKLYKDQVTNDAREPKKNKPSNKEVEYRDNSTSPNDPEIQVANSKNNGIKRTNVQSKEQVSVTTNVSNDAEPKVIMGDKLVG